MNSRKSRLVIDIAEEDRAHPKSKPLKITERGNTVLRFLPDRNNVFHWKQRTDIPNSKFSLGVQVATVVLLGCSTSWKSSAVRRFAKHYGNEFETVDTDRYVAADSEFKGHLYAMYLKFTSGADLSAARLYLEIGERHLLRQLAAKQGSMLIAAGPNIALREPEWSRFLAAVNPICFYFRLSALELYEGLKERRNRQRSQGLDLCAGFGCWDSGLATEFDGESQTWQELSLESALPRIESYLARVEPLYLSACEPQHVFQGSAIKQDKELQDRLLATFASCLRWEPVRTEAPGQFEQLAQEIVCLA